MTRYGISFHRGKGKMSEVEKILLESLVISLRDDKDFQEFLQIVNNANKEDDCKK